MASLSNSVIAAGYDKARIPPGKKELLNFIGPRIAMSRVPVRLRSSEHLVKGRFLEQIARELGI